MIGTLLNTAAILVGGTVGLTVAKDLSQANQQRLKILLGALSAYVGISLMWQSFNGTFGQVLGQFGIMMLSLMLGNLTGKLIGIQRGLNKLGQFARERFSSAASASATSAGKKFSEGFVTCTLLFCVGPMAILGAVQDGLTGSIKTLAIKSAMDGLATMAFAKTFGWGVMLAAIPVLAYQGTWTLGAQSLQPLLAQKELLDAINAAGGFLVFTISLVILEIRRVELADYLPSLIYAPLLTWWWR
jgi:uncharacterized protein